MLESYKKKNSHLEEENRKLEKKQKYLFDLNNKLKSHSIPPPPPPAPPTITTNVSKIDNNQQQHQSSYSSNYPFNNYSSNDQQHYSNYSAQNTQLPEEVFSSLSKVASFQKNDSNLIQNNSKNELKNQNKQQQMSTLNSYQQQLDYYAALMANSSHPHAQSKSPMTVEELVKAASTYGLIPNTSQQTKPIPIHNNSPTISINSNTSKKQSKSKSSNNLSPSKLNNSSTSVNSFKI
jgi:hypothetical protein